MYLTGTPRRDAISRAMSGATPSGSPDGARPVTRRKLPILIAARRTPVGASSDKACCGIRRSRVVGQTRLVWIIGREQARKIVHSRILRRPPIVGRGFPAHRHSDLWITLLRTTRRLRCRVESNPLRDLFIKLQQSI